MEQRARYVMVGSTAVALLILLVLAVLWVSGAGEEGRFTHYTIYFRQQSLSGLQVDSNVTMRGIKIGSVRDIQILPGDIESVKVVLRVQANTPVKTDTKAVIQRNLLTGLAMIDLIGSTQGAPLLNIPPKGEVYPVIAEGVTGLAAIQSAMPELVQSINQLVLNANEVFSEENRTALAVILRDLQAVSEEISGHRAELGQALAALSELSVGANKMMQSTAWRLEQMADSFDALAQGVLRQTTLAGRGFDTVAGKLSVTADRLQDPKALIFGPADTILGPGEGR